MKSSFQEEQKSYATGRLLDILQTTVAPTIFFPLMCSVASGSVRGGEVHPLEPMTNSVNVLKSKAALMKLHCQLAHFSPERMARIDPNISPADFKYIRSCAVCKRAKLHGRPFPSKPDCVKATTAGEVVALDLLTMTKKTWDNKGYMLVLVDQHTRFIAIFAYKDKKSLCGLF